MAAVIRDEDGAILAASGHIQEARSALVAENNRVTAEINGWSATWRGQGANSFKAFKDAWDARFKKLMASLDELESKLKTTSNEFQASDSDIGKDFEKLSGNIPS